MRWSVAACATGFFVVALTGLTNKFGVADEPAPFAQQLVFAPIVMALGWLVVRLLRRGIWLDDDGVLIRNTLRTYRLRWEEVASIEPPSAYGSVRNSGLRIVRTSGDHVYADLFAAGPMNTGHQASDVVDTFRQQLDHHRRRS